MLEQWSWMGKHSAAAHEKPCELSLMSVILRHGGKIS